MKKIVPEHIKKLSPYLPGLPIEEVKQQFHLKKVSKLASNENPFGVSPRAIQTIKKSLALLNRYPEGSGRVLRKKLANHLGVKSENIILGNGSDEIIQLIVRTFLESGDEVVISEHVFVRFEQETAVLDNKIIFAPMKDFTHDLKAMRKAITPKTKLIFVANPNNPTGTYVTKQEVEKFMQKIPKKVIVVFDEAYYEYIKKKDYPETIKYVRNGYNVIILRTFSKIYGLAGLRIGYGIAPARLIDYLNRVRPPFNTNSLAQVAACVSLDDVNQVLRIRKLTEEGRKYLCAELRALDIYYVPSVTNFILIDLKRNAKIIFQKLLRKGVIVRSMEGYGFPTCIRVTIGLPEENQHFIQALKEIV